MSLIINNKVNNKKININFTYKFIIQYVNKDNKCSNSVIHPVNTFFSFKQLFIVCTVFSFVNEVNRIHAAA